MLRTLSLVTIAGSVIVFAAGSLQAQTRTGSTTGSGLFGQGSTGSGASAGNRATTTGGSSGTTGTGGTSGTGSGGSGGGITQGPAPGSQQNVATTAMQDRQRYQTTQAVGEFAGADAADTQNFLSRQQGATRTTNNLNGLQNLFSQGLQQLNQQSQRATRPQIRVPLRMGFAPPPVSFTHVRRFETHLAKLPGVQFTVAPQVVMEGRTAVLKGVVASEDDRRLAETLAKMEPEVLAVRNELTVAAPGASTAEELPRGTP